MPTSHTCQECGDYVSMPYECNYCGQSHCSNHRLPEKHNCTHAKTDSKPGNKMFGPSVPGVDDNASSAGRSKNARIPVIIIGLFILILKVLFSRKGLLTLLILGSITLLVLHGIGVISLSDITLNTVGKQVSPVGDVF